ncbi:hypothetical protein BDW62DRAFT_196184 [Aspergillus aurantiobrunneus]
MCKLLESSLKALSDNYLGGFIIIQYGSNMLGVIGWLDVGKMRQNEFPADEVIACITKLSINNVLCDVYFFFLHKGR